jgi:hypothetical protein
MMSEESYLENNISPSEDMSMSKQQTSGRMGVFIGNKPETQYQFIDNKSEVLNILRKFKDCNALCEICKRSDHVLIGPFVKYGEDDKIIGSPLYFHQDCIEINQFSYFSLKDN